MAPRWGRIAADFHTNPKAVLAGVHGRAVFVFAICLNAADSMNGRLRRGYFGPNYLATHLGITVKQAAAGLDAAVASGLLRVDDQHVVMVGWDEEWAPARAGKDRQAEFRKRKAENSSDESVTTSDAKVTAVTTEENRSEEKRSDQKRVKRSAADKPPPHPDHRRFVDEFQLLYVAANGGSKPSWGSKQGAWVSDLLKRHGFDESLKRARNMFTAPPPWPAAPHDLSTLVQHFDRFAQPHNAKGASRYHAVTGNEIYPDGEVKL